MHRKVNLKNVTLNIIGVWILVLAAFSINSFAQRQRIYVNKDFRNTTGRQANDLHIIMAGSVAVNSYYRGPFQNASPTYNPGTDETTVNYSNPPQGPFIQPNRVIHVGFTATANGTSMRGVVWTFNGMPIGRAAQVGGTFRVTAAGGAGELSETQSVSQVQYDACNNQAFPQDISNVLYAVIDSPPIPLERLQNLNNELNDELAARGTQLTPIDDSFPTLYPGDCVPISIPDAVSTDQYVVLVYNVTTETDPEAQTTDFLQFGPID